MAENKVGPNIGAGAGIFAKRVQKSLNRAQEKVLQKLGKNMETRDEQFEQCSQNLLRQQTDGGRLLKDVRAYFTAVKAMHESSKRLSQTLKDVYETDWLGGEDLAVIMESEDLLWNDYEEKLTDQLVRTMENYTSQFPEVKERVAKRGRKLVDYDSSRHHLEALQSAKKKDEAKSAKAEEEFNKAQNVFEEINKELREELPVLYQSRIGCYVTVFQNVSNLRDVFYKEMSVLNHELYNVMKTLETQHSGKAFIIKGLNSTTKSTKTRKSIVISAPIPCNTAFPASHTSLHSASDQNGKDPTASPSAVTSEAPTDAPASAQPAEGSATPSEASDSEELSADTPTPQTARSGDNGEKSDVAGESRPESAVQEEVASSQSGESTTATEEGRSQRSEVTGGTEVAEQEATPARSTERDALVPRAEEENAPEAEPIQGAKAKAPPVPAPRLNVHSHGPHVEVSQEEEEGFQEQLTNTKCTGDDSDSQGPPGFLYKAVALEALASAGPLQFKEGDVILVLADTQKQAGMLRGVREESWIQHRDLADHSGIFMEKLIRPVQSE